LITVVSRGSHAYCCNYIIHGKRFPVVYTVYKCGFWLCDVCLFEPFSIVPFPCGPTPSPYVYAKNDFFFTPILNCVVVTIIIACIENNMIAVLYTFWLQHTPTHTEPVCACIAAVLLSRGLRCITPLASAPPPQPFHFKQLFGGWSFWESWYV